MVCRNAASIRYPYEKPTDLRVLRQPCARSMDFVVARGSAVNHSIQGSAPVPLKSLSYPFTAVCATLMVSHSQLCRMHTDSNGPLNSPVH